MCHFLVKQISEREFVFSKIGFVDTSSPSFYQSWVREPLLFRRAPLPPPPPHAHFYRANWKTSVIILILAQIWWDQRWPAGRGRGADGCMLRRDQAKALQVLTPPLPWVPGWGGSGSGNLPELSGMTSRLPLHHPLLCSHMAPTVGALKWGSDLRKINCGRAEEGKPHSLGWVHENESIN